MHALFYLFGIMHTLSYTTSIIWGFTLDYERGVFGMLLILINFRYLNRSAVYFNIAVLYISIFSALFSQNLTNHINDAIGFILYYNIVLIYWKMLCEEPVSEIKRLTQLYTFIALPLLIYISPLLLDPFRVKLDFYTDPTLERLGLKSRTVGWAAACTIPMVFEWLKKPGLRRFFLVPLAALLFVVVLGSGSRSSIIGVSVYILITILYSNVKYRMSWALVSIVISIFILSNSEELSLTRRAKLQEMGVSDDTYRYTLVTEFIDHLGNDFPNSLLPSGFGDTNMQYAINKFYDTNGLGTHNTYITIFMSLGIFSMFFFVKLLKSCRFMISKRQLTNYLPFLVVSVTEDCFGPGQLLFMFLIALLVVTSK